MAGWMNETGWTYKRLSVMAYNPSGVDREIRFAGS